MPEWGTQPANRYLPRVVTSEVGQPGSAAITDPGIDGVEPERPLPRLAELFALKRKEA